MLIRGNVSSKKTSMLDQGMDCPASNTSVFNDSHAGAGKRRLSGVPGNISDGYDCFEKLLGMVAHAL